MQKQDERRRPVLRRLGVLAVVALSLFGATQVGGAIGSNVTVGSDRYNVTSQAKFLGTAPQVDVTVTSVTLPAGNWVVHTDSTAVGLNQIADVVRCFIVAPGLKTGHATEVGNASDYPIVGQISVTAALTLTEQTVVRSRCHHDNNTGSNYYIDPQASIWAHRA